MKYQYCIFIVILFPAFLFGCRKSEGLVDQDIFISKYTSGDTEYHYYYDSEYKLTSIQRKHTSSGNVNLEIRYSEHDEHHIPRRADFIKHLGPPGPVYYQYELDNLSRVKEYRGYALDKLQFTVQFNYLFNRIERIETLSPSGIVIKFIYTVDGNGNVVQLDRITNDTFIAHSNSYLAHDNQKNWYSLLPLTALFNEIYSMNNAIKIQSNAISSGVVTHTTVNIEYNSEGYPVRSVSTLEGNSTGSEAFYEYIRR